MDERDLERIYKYPIYPRDSKVHSDRAFVNIDNGFQGGTHWTCIILKKTNHNITLTVSESDLINFY